MNTHKAITDASRLSDVKRRVLDKYLRGNGAEVGAAQQRIPHRPAGESVPLSFSQQQVWLHSQMAGDVPIYNEAIAVYRRGSLDIVVLERCLTEVIRRHEIWRTTFDTINGETIQVVQAADNAFPLKTIDLRHLCEPERLAEAMSLATEEARTPFNLKMGPLLRATLVRIDEEQYRLYMTFHQLIFDAVTAYRVFLPELVLLYDAYSVGSPSPLPEPALQYGDFAYWQRKTVAPDAWWSTQLSFWREKLSGELPLLQWPNDRPRPIHQTHRGAIQRFKFDSSLIAPLKAFCRQERVSSYMVCLASYAALLSRYTGQEDILLGGLSAGRKWSEVEGVLGYFVNPLSLRVDLSGNPSFRELISRVRDTVLDVLANDEVPFEKVVEALQIRPDPGRNAIFQFILSQQPQMPATGSGWDLITEEVSNGGSKLDLDIVLDERPDAISGPITYNPDLFEPETIRRMIDHWQTLLQSALADPNQRLSESPILTKQERRFFVEWNDTSADYPRDNCIHQLLENQEERTPNAIALVDERTRLTYKQLNQRANRLAHYLRGLGMGSQSLVGVCLERSAEMVIGLLGILKAGAAYVPLDPTYPTDRLTFMLADSGCKILVTRSDLMERFPQTPQLAVCVDTQADAIAQHNAENPSGGVAADQLAYLIYTSGSTGKPKGILATHRAAINRFHWMWTTFPFEAGEMCCQKTSLSFVDSVWEIFGPLLRGTPIAIIRDQAMKDPGLLIKSLRRHRVSRIVLVPSLLQTLLESSPNLASKLPRLKFCVSSGEPLPLELAKRFYECLPHCRLLNLYGSSEVAGDVTCCEPQNLESLRSVPIGRPIANSQVYILDRNLQLAPIGISGELYVGGDSLARGYLNHPELTAERFLPSPFTGDPGARLYRTGDWARFLPDGNIEFLGRCDQQVKIRGFRIELAEIEQALVKHPNVKAVAITARENLANEKRVVAYVVLGENHSLTTRELREFLANQLPDYMVPAQFVFLEALPLLPNGKLDGRALPLPEHTNRLPADEFASPRNAVESQLAKIWEAMFSRHPIGITQNFFDLGGHSLLAAKLLVRVEEVFGRKLALLDIFQAPSIAQLAGILKEPAPRRTSNVVPIQPNGSNPPLFIVRGGPLFLPLARRLGSNQPMLGLHLLPADVAHVPARVRFEDIAGALIVKLLQVQPQGPYHLGGLCVNGVIAYEMATQLSAQGRQVGLVVLFDSKNPALYHDFSQQSYFHMLWQKFVYHGRKATHLPKKDWLPYLRERREELQRKRKRITWQLAYNLGRANDGYDIDGLDPLVHPAASSYCPQSYSGSVDFFQSSDWPKGIYWDFQRGWRDLVRGRYEVHKIRWGHESMFYESNVDAVAEKLSFCLRRAGTYSKDDKSFITSY